VNADKKIVWEFSATANPDSKFAAPSNAFFTPGFRSIIVTQSPNHQITEIDYATRKIVWAFGEWGVAGSDNAHFNTPDSALRLSDGRTVVADARNCRVAILSSAPKIISQIGKTGQCKNEAGLLAKPNGVTLLANGNLLITEATTRRVSEMDLQGKIVRAVTLPVVAYPSDAQPTRAGNILVAAYEKPGRILEVDWSGQIVWEYFPKAEAERLDRPSIAMELPNGNIAFSDDYNDRVAIVNRAGKILWQYGVTGVAGKASGYLNTPNGIDFRAIPIPATTPTAVAPTPAR
jgi:DNA-binding beta-propeller fold protein YncE